MFHCFKTCNVQSFQPENAFESSEAFNDGAESSQPHWILGSRESTKGGREHTFLPWGPDSMELDGIVDHPDPSNVEDLANENNIPQDLDMFLQDSYEILGLSPTTGMPLIDDLEKTLSCTTLADSVPPPVQDILSATPVLNSSPVGVTTECITQTPFLFREVKRVTKTDRSQQSTQGYRKLWTTESYSKTFRIAKQPKRPLTDAEKANKALIVKVGPCISCFRSGGKCSQDPNNPNEPCEGCKNRLLNPSLGTLTLPCTRIYLDKNMFQHPGN
ncbi:hypothetical protein TWF281_004761 [Arthrobotrys megalospora]